MNLVPSLTGEKYVLIVRDGLSNYSWLFPFSNNHAENASRAIIDWCAAFGTPKKFMSDGPTNFKNETLSVVSKFLSVAHQFTLHYCP